MTCNHPIAAVRRKQTRLETLTLWAFHRLPCRWTSRLYLAAQRRNPNPYYCIVCGHWSFDIFEFVPRPETD